MPPFVEELLDKIYDYDEQAEVNVGMQPYVVELSNRNIRVSKSKACKPGDVAKPGYKLQWVVDLECDDCHYFFPFAEPNTNWKSLAKEHLDSETHRRNVRLRCIAVSETVRKAVSCITGGDAKRGEETLKDMKRSRISLDQIDKRCLACTGETILIRAVKSIDIHGLSHLLAHDPPLTVERKGWTGRNALHWACALGRTKMGKMLLGKDAPLCDRVLKRRATWDLDYYTPLDLAVQGGHIDTAVDLVVHEAKTVDIDSALQYACIYGNSDIIQKLIATNAFSTEGRLLPPRSCSLSPLEEAFRFASAGAVRILFEAGARVEHIFWLQSLFTGLQNSIHGRPSVPGEYRDAAEKLSLLERYCNK